MFVGDILNYYHCIYIHRRALVCYTITIDKNNRCDEKRKGERERASGRAEDIDIWPSIVGIFEGIVINVNSTVANRHLAINECGFCTVDNSRKEAITSSETNFTLHFPGEIERDYTQQDKRSTTLGSSNMTVTFFLISYHRKKLARILWGEKRIDGIKLIEFDAHLERRDLSFCVASIMDTSSKLASMCVNYLFSSFII